MTLKLLVEHDYHCLSQCTLRIETRAVYLFRWNFWPDVFYSFTLRVSFFDSIVHYEVVVQASWSVLCLSQFRILSSFLLQYENVCCLNISEAVTRRQLCGTRMEWKMRKKRECERDHWSGDLNIIALFCFVSLGFEKSNKIILFFACICKYIFESCHKL